MQDNPMIRKVRGLLETAESFAEQGNEAAAKSYSEKAHALLSKYELDAALLQQASEIRKPIVKKLYVEGHYFLRWGNMLHVLARVHGCRTVHSPSRKTQDGKWHNRNRSQYITLFGFEEDVEAVELLWTSLMVQATSAMLRQTVPSGVNKYTFQFNFLDAFIHEVHMRLSMKRQQAIKEREKEDDGKNLLPVLQDRSKRVDAVVDETYGRLRKGAATGTRTSAAGYDAGRAAGKTASLGSVSLPSSRKALGR